MARAPRPSAATVAQFTMQSRNLANNLNSQFGTQISPNDFLKAVQPQQPQRNVRQQSAPQFAGRQLRERTTPFAPGEEMDNLVAAMNGPQGYPDFHWVNPAGVDAFLAHSPESTNIEDRRGESYDAQAAQVRPRAGKR